ncbi:MAG TPA: hypothetical protein VLC97_16760 [Rhodanobacteraceae bacterium]|nr:hypothetical protein [Rhodanobacteraceae bacterium]
MGRHLRICVIVAALAATAIHSPHACAFNVFKVDKDCVAAGAYATIQEAINYASLYPGTDYIWISSNHAYEETVSIVDQDLIIEGGFTDCNDFDIGPNDRSYISGLDKLQPLISISGNSHVVLSNLGIGGANAGLFDGAGVHFDGQGELTISDSEVDYGQAERGGAIYFNGTGGPATLTLGEKVSIFNNEAIWGGGIYVSGQARLLMLSPDTTVVRNGATYGGGIYIDGSARADIGAPGLSGSLISENGADYGGGIGVGASAVVRIFPHDATNPSGINSNSATLYGGGIYAEGDVCLFSPSLEGNAATQGGALFHKGSGGIYVNAGFPARLGGECGPETIAALGGTSACDGDLCNLIDDNTAVTQYELSGGVIFEQGGDLVVSRVKLEYNSAGSVIETNGKTTDIRTSLFDNNHLTDALVIVDNTFSANASFTGSTFAADTIGGDYVFRFLDGAGGTLTRDIIAEAPKLSVSASGPLTVNYVMSSEIGTLPHAGNASVVAADPRFVFLSPGYGDFHLATGSPALDFAPAVAGDVDIEMKTRSIDLPDLPNIFGSTDLGAYERQYLCAADQIFCNGFDR